MLPFYFYDAKMVHLVASDVQKTLFAVMDAKFSKKVYLCSAKVSPHTKVWFLVGNSYS